MIYEVDHQFNLAAWESTVSEGPKDDPEETLVELCAADPSGITRVEAVQRLGERGQSRTNAYRIIDRALKNGLVRLEENTLRANA